MSDIPSLAKSEGFQNVHADAVHRIHSASKDVVKRMVHNASKVATVCRVKKIKTEHFKLVENIQTGGRVVLPAAYFEGQETEAYYSKEVVAPFETTASFGDINELSRAEHPIKVLGGSIGSKGKIDDAFVHETFSSMNTGFSLDKEAKSFVTDKVHNFNIVLMKSVRKAYPKAKTLKESMVEKVMKKSLLA